MASEPTASALDLSMRLAHSEMARNGDDLSFGGFDSVSNRDAAWRYTTGLLAQALDDLSMATSEDEYAAWARKTIDSYITDDGSIRTYKLKDFNIDKINSGKMLLRLYQRHGDEKYLQAAKLLREQLEKHPRTSEGAFWHKKIYPWQIWLDGVYMGMPFLAQYAALTGEEGAMEEAVKEFIIVRKHLRDPESGLYYHGWDEKRLQDWADPVTGLSSQFWSRGMGWFAMALVDVLDFLPEDRTDLRQPLLDMLPELVDALLEHHHEGGWYQVTDQPNKRDNYLEASASAMFVYTMAKALNKGYLGPDYLDVVLDAWSGIVKSFVSAEEDGMVNLNRICAVAGLGRGRDGSFEYYMSEPIISNEPKGTGPFIMAGIQVNELLENPPNN